MAKVRVRLQANRHIYIHNDLANAAHYFMTKVKERIARNDCKGIGIEVMAGLTMLAFAVEAKFNFLGDRLIEGWDERARAMEKVEAVCSCLGVDADFAVGHMPVSRN